MYGLRYFKRRIGLGSSSRISAAGIYDGKH